MHTVPPTYPRGHADRIIDPPLLRFEPGARIVNSRGILGTLGCFALTLDDRRVVFLTSQHVLFGAGAREQEPVWLLDAAESRSIRPIARSRHGRCGTVHHGGVDVHIDCATVELDDQTMLQGLFAVEDCTNQTPTVKAGDHVTKIGAATGTTHGIVEDTAFSNIASVNGRSYETIGQILVRPLAPADAFTADGDSGAALQNQEGHVVGLLWGADALGYGLACPIAPVLHVLHVCLARFQPTGAS